MVLASIIGSSGSVIPGQASNAEKQSSGLTNIVDRLRMLPDERRQWLEQLGHVPDDATPEEWRFAEGASWWGKRINAEEFWKERVVWLDDSAIDSARRLGRGYPPMSFEDPGVSRYSDEDVRLPRHEHEVEGASIRFVYSAREGAFWNRFVLMHPSPPDVIEQAQYQAAESVLTHRIDCNSRGNPTRIRANEFKLLDDVAKNQAVSAGAPPEAMDDDALFWTYVMRRRNEYRKLVDAHYKTNSAPFKILFSSMVVDGKLLTAPLGEEDIRVANAWKIAFLHRLRNEHADEKYIGAYLKAWGLNMAVVFTNASDSAVPSTK